jgi:hypothetical protein
MRRFITVVAIVTGFAATVATGFWFGLREGWSLGQLAAAAPAGALAVRLLDASRSGRSDVVALFLESEVNRGLLMSHQLAASPLSSMLGPVWGFEAFPTETSYVVRLANFRRANPSPFKIDAFDAVPPGMEERRDYYRELAASRRENAKIINEMVAKFSAAR